MQAPALRFAYSTINWGTTPDLPAAFREIRQAGWSAVELFNHSLDWLGPREHLSKALGRLQPATSFGSIELPISADQLTVHKRRMDYAAQLGVEMYGLVGGSRQRMRPPTDADYSQLAQACEELARYGARHG